MKNSSTGIYLHTSKENIFYHNNFINNTNQADIIGSFNNTGDNGMEGNYWSDYAGLDLDRDGIGDDPYVVDQNNNDTYPLMGVFSDFDATAEYNVQTVCNSTIPDFQYDGTIISFNVTGEDGTDGFCRMCIPTALMSDYQVFVMEQKSCMIYYPHQFPTAHITTYTSSIIISHKK